MTLAYARASQPDVIAPMIDLRFFQAFICLLVLVSPLKGTAEDTGSICLGPNEMFVPYTPEEHVSLTIGDSEKLDFLSQEQEPRVVLNGLGLNKIYPVRVYWQGKVTHSWKLDFRKFKSRVV